LPSISSKAPCREALTLCLRGEPVKGELIDRALAIDEGRAFLSIVVERLGDLFEPRLCDVYEELFPRVIKRVYPELMPRVRRVPGSLAAPDSVDRVYVLSRVTLGADVAVTSVLLDAAKKRYPRAEILFVGPKKNYELFEADARVSHVASPYPRSSALRDRLAASAALELTGGIVIDPDSRLTQLGLIRICDDADYFFFPSRAYGGDGLDRLPDLAARWAREVFGITDARPFIAPLPVTSPPADITVSLGVGENPAKRMEGAFESELLKMLAETGASVLVDSGGSEEERARVEAVVQPGMGMHVGAFAPFAFEIARSKLFVGYDSAGGHIASACGVPLISIALGFASERMAARWRPSGTVIRDANAQIVRDAVTCTFRR
jgi:glycosyl transferase family 9 (putative heptosyltransferase)